MYSKTGGKIWCHFPQPVNLSMPLTFDIFSLNPTVPVLHLEQKIGYFYQGFPYINVKSYLVYKILIIEENTFQIHWCQSCQAGIHLGTSLVTQFLIVRPWSKSKYKSMPLSQQTPKVEQKSSEKGWHYNYIGHHHHKKLGLGLKGQSTFILSN